MQLLRLIFVLQHAREDYVCSAGLDRRVPEQVAFVPAECNETGFG